MRGVNTLLAILQARNDATETKTRTLEDALSERDSRITVLLQQQVLCFASTDVAGPDKETTVTRASAILQEESVKLQDKYTADLGRITIDADQEVRESTQLKLFTTSKQLRRGPALVYGRHMAFARRRDTCKKKSTGSQEATKTSQRN